MALRLPPPWGLSLTSTPTDIVLHCTLAAAPETSVLRLGLEERDRDRDRVPKRQAWLQTEIPKER